MSEWRSLKLGDVLTLQRGFDITRANQRPGTIPVVSSSGIGSYHSEAMVPGPGVVIGRKGSLGTSFFLKQSFWPHDTTLWVKDFKGNDPHFCYFLLKSMDLAKFDVGAANPTLNRNHVHLLDVRCPAVTTQRRIASILGAYDDLIDLNRRRIALLEEIARRLFEEWFVHFRFPGHEGHTIVETPEGRLPQGWSLTPLGDVCREITDGSHFSPPSVEAGQMMASVKDMRDWDFDLSGCRRISSEDFDELVRNGCQPDVGDILIAKDGANLNKHTFLMWRDLPLVLLSSIAILRPLLDFEREYLIAILKSEATSAAIKQMKSGAAIPRIVLRDFKRLRIALPPRDLRQAFDKVAGPIHQLIRRISLANGTLAISRDYLLPRLVSGELPVENAEFDLEAVA